VKSFPAGNEQSCAWLDVFPPVRRQRVRKGTIKIAWLPTQLL
jgi:hypothetical protein